jgi:hypothetical protein
MSDRPDLEDLVQYLVRSSRLSRQEAVRVIDEVLAFMDERAEEFVCRRHRELQGEGLGNDQIFERIARELPWRRFRAPALTERQIRRLIYG